MDIEIGSHGDNRRLLACEEIERYSFILDRLEASSYDEVVARWGRRWGVSLLKGG